MIEIKAAWATGAITVALLLTGLLGGATAATPASPTGPVLAIDQSPGPITEQSVVNVSLEVANSADVNEVYFTFCQLTNSLCYQPVLMDPNGTNWYEGSTNPMMTYKNPDGSHLSVGERVGYNITVVLTNGTNLSEPGYPNAFTNLKTAQSVTDEWLFEVQVQNQAYGLSGRVTNTSSGAAISGATVTLTPSNESTTTTSASGAYSFTGVPNGTYTVYVNATGYRASSTSVVINGKAAVQDVAMTSTFLPIPKNNNTTTSPSFFTTPLGIGTLAVVAVLVVITALVAVTISRRRGRGRNASAQPPPEPSPPAAEK